MKSKTLTLCSILSVAASMAFADWTVVSTFDDASALDKITDVTNIEGSDARSEIVDGKWAVYPGDLFESTSNLYAHLDLGVDLLDSTTSGSGVVTLYFEVIHPLVGGELAVLDTVWGMSNGTPETVLESRYNSYSVMQRINAGTLGFEGFNGLNNPAGYEAIDQFQGDVTYQIWIVVDFGFNYHEVYVKGGQWTEQTRIGTAVTDGFWGFRVNPGDGNVAQYFLIALSRGNSVDGEKGIDPTYFDNVAYDITGENLSEPDLGGSGGAMWGNYSVTTMGSAQVANTGDWLGLVEVSHATANGGWVYVFDLENWLFVPDADDPNSVSEWVYVFK